MAHPLYVLDNKVYKYIFRILNTYLFSKATMVARTCLNVTLCVHCLHCYKFKSGGLCEKHEAATLNLEIISAFARARKKDTKTCVEMACRRSFQLLNCSYKSKKNFKLEINKIRIKRFSSCNSKEIMRLCYKD
jgi:hypothetical protein